MPIFLPAPLPVRPADGKGFNRLSLNAHMWPAEAQCALRPRSYATLFESLDTRRARWGGFGTCSRPDGLCGDCPVLTHPPRRSVNFDAHRVLVRIETSYSDGAALRVGPRTQLWMTDRPHSADFQNGGQLWTWPELSRLEGWELGRRHRDEVGEGFWMERSSHVPAPHVEIRSRAVGTDVRHAMLADSTRACLMVCSGGCRHDAQLLNAISHQIPGQVDKQPAQVDGDRLQRPAAEGAWRLIYSAAGSAAVRLLEADRQVVRLSLSGSQWTSERVDGVGSALLKHVRR